MPEREGGERGGKGAWLQRLNPLREVKHIVLSK